MGHRIILNPLVVLFEQLNLPRACVMELEKGHGTRQDTTCARFEYGVSNVWRIPV
jgi:hypothetical protein